MTDPMLSRDGWPEVRWTEAAQIVELIEDGSEPPTPDVSPRAHFVALRQAGDRLRAVAFIGHALPRFEALAWAARVLEDEAGQALPQPDRQALDHALRWLGEPTEAGRREAMAAGERAGERSPERTLAFAVFMSGGSLADPDLPPVPPPAHLAGQLAAVAVTVAAYRAAEPDAVLDRALDLGDKLAAHGVRFLESA